MAQELRFPRFLEKHAWISVLSSTLRPEDVMRIHPLKRSDVALLQVDSDETRWFALIKIQGDTTTIQLTAITQNPELTIAQAIQVVTLAYRARILRLVRISIEPLDIGHRRVFELFLPPRNMTWQEASDWGVEKIITSTFNHQTGRFQKKTTGKLYAFDRKRKKRKVPAPAASS